MQSNDKGYCGLMEHMSFMEGAKWHKLEAHLIALRDL